MVGDRLTTAVLTWIRLHSDVQVGLGLGLSRAL